MPSVPSTEDQPSSDIGPYCFKIRPNPTAGSFMVELNKDYINQCVTLYIYGTMGEKVMTQMLRGEPKHEVSLAGRPSGMYFIHAITGNKVETAKIIKR